MKCLFERDDEDHHHHSEIVGGDEDNAILVSSSLSQSVKEVIVSCVCVCVK